MLLSGGTDFDRDGITNFRKYDWWVEDNFHNVFQSRHQQRLGINLWPDTVGYYLIGMNVLPRRLTGGHYRDFLLKAFHDLREDLPVAFRKCIWFAL
jgi:hypothetical protein